ncbi:hypothetical protein [Streptomyces sp. NPDC006997]
MSSLATGAGLPPQFLGDRNGRFGDFGVLDREIRTSLLARRGVGATG